MHQLAPTIDSGAGDRRLSVIYNPVAGLRHGRRFRATLRALRELGYSIDVTETARPGDAEAAARAHASMGGGPLAAAGGDGTINEVVNGLMRVATPPPLALIPLGTANVLAHEIGLATNPRQIAKAIAAGRPKSVRPGRINGRYFMMMAGAGFDAEVVARVDPALKRRTGKLAYVLATLAEARRYPFPLCEGSIDGRPFAARWIVVCHGRHYGGSYVVAPEADLADRRLVACLLPGAGMGQVLRYGFALTTGRFPRLADLTFESGTRIRIDGPAGLCVQGDGDIVARLPAEITLADRELELIVPA